MNFNKALAKTDFYFLKQNFYFAFIFMKEERDCFKPFSSTRANLDGRVSFFRQKKSIQMNFKGM